MFALALLFVPDVSFADRFARASGNWNNAGGNIWSAVSCAAGAITASAPGAGDDVTICAGRTVTLNVAGVANTLTIAGGAPGGTLLGSTNTLMLDNSPAFTIDSGGVFTPGTGTVLLNRDGATTVVAGTATSVSFNNLTLAPALGGNRIYTMNGGSATQINVGSNFSIIPSGTAARSLTVNFVAAAPCVTLNVTGTTLIQPTGGPPPVTLDTTANDCTLTSGRLDIEAGATFNANGSTVTLNGGAGPLFTRAGTFTPGTSTVVMNSPASVTLTSGTITFDNLTVSMPGQTGTLGNSIAVNTALLTSAGTLANGGFPIAGDGTGSFQVNDGATFTMTGTAVFPTAFSAYSFQPSSTVRYLQTNAQTVSARTYGDLEVSPAANNVTHTFQAGTSTVAGNLTLGNGTNTGVVVTAAPNNSVLDVNGNVSISANSTLTGHASNAFTVAGSWINNGAFCPGSCVPASFAGTVTFDSTTATQGISGATTFNNLTIANTFGLVTANSSLTVNAALTLNASAQFADGGNIVTVKGNVANSGTHSGTGRIELSGGAAAHTLSGSGAYGSLRINDALGATLTGSPTVNGALTFLMGNITTGANTLTVAAAGTSSAGAFVSHLVGNLAKGFNATNLSFIYAVGDGTNYLPVTVSFPSAAFLVTPGVLILTALSATDHPDTANSRSSINANTSINRYWTLRSPAATGLAGSYNATVTYLNTSPAERDAGVTVVTGNLTNALVARGVNCAGSGAARSCQSWVHPTTSATPTVTQASAAGSAITASPLGAVETDLVVGEMTRFLREDEFVYSREQY